MYTARQRARFAIKTVGARGAGEALWLFPSRLRWKNETSEWVNFRLEGVIQVRRKRVEFDAHVTVKKPTEVAFTTKNGKPVDLIAKKPTKEEVHVDFLANPKKK
jgi:hypothetical protein